MSARRSWLSRAAALLCLAALPAAGAESAPWTAFQPTLMLVPPEVPNPTLDKGCWIRLSDGPEFSGQSFVLVGPAELRALDLSAISRFRRRVASAETGPKGRAALYSEEGFAGAFVALEPSSQEGNVARALGRPGRHVAALRLSCAN